MKDGKRRDLRNFRMRDQEIEALMLRRECTEAYCKLNARWTTSGKPLAIGCLRGRELAAERATFHCTF